MVIARGDIFWADLPPPIGSETGFRRPVVVVQSNALNKSRIGTVLCIPLTSNMRRADAPGNVVLPARKSGLPRDSIANVAHVLAVDRSLLIERSGYLAPRDVEMLLTGLDIVLGR